MAGRLLNSTFEGFGSSWLAADREPRSISIAVGRTDRLTRRRIRQHCLGEPGVYGMITAEGELIYVGKSRRLRERLLSYFFQSANRTKARRIVEQAASIVCEPAPSELAALLRELELIRHWRPRLNVRGKLRRRRRTFVALGRRPAPHVYLTARPCSRDSWIFGPVRAGRRFRDVVRRVNDCFQLRDCNSTSIAFADQQELFPENRQPCCLRRDLGTCLAPCAVGCTREQYFGRVQAALDFLRGRDVRILDRLRDAMNEAARKRAFEYAAMLRDIAGDMQLLHRRLAQWRKVRRRFAFVQPLPGYDGNVQWYLIDRAEVAALVPAPHDADSAGRCLAALDAVYPTRNGRRIARSTMADAPPEDIDVVLAVCSWFRDNPQQRRQRLWPAQARALCKHLLSSPARQSS